MAQKAKNSAVVLVRARESVRLAPATMGYSKLLEPDDYDPAKPMFKVDCHLSPAAIEATAATIAEHCYSKERLEKLREEMDNNGFKWKEPMDPKEWLGNKLKDPNERAVVQLPKLVLSTKAQFKSRSGELVTKDMACWDLKNNLLDLAGLKLGKGSVIQAVVHPNIFASKTVDSGTPQPKLDLVGVSVVKLVRFGGQRAPDEVDEEEIKAVLGETFDVDEDLSAYAVGASSPTPPANEANGGMDF